MTEKLVSVGDCLGYATEVYNDEISGFYIIVPSLPGCASQGETIDECFKNIEDAIELYVQIMAEDVKENQA